MFLSFLLCNLHHLARHHYLCPIRAFCKPIGLSTAAYKKVFENSSIWTGYINTIYYVVGGTAINIAMTVIGAYFLSRKNIPGKGIITVFIMFTMYFSGGMIPAFLNIQSLGLYDTRAARFCRSYNTQSDIMHGHGFS